MMRIEKYILVGTPPGDFTQKSFLKLMLERAINRHLGSILSLSLLRFNTNLTWQLSFHVCICYFGQNHKIQAWTACLIYIVS